MLYGSFLAVSISRETSSSLQAPLGPTVLPGRQRDFGRRIFVRPGGNLRRGEGRQGKKIKAGKKYKRKKREKEKEGNGGLKVNYGKA